MITTNLTTDQAILAEMGCRIANHRLQQHMTQAQFAYAAGVSKRTVERIEAGESIQLVNFVRTLRVLKMLDGLDRFLPEATPNPVDLLKRRGKIRKRARPSARSDGDVGQPWSWGDEP